MGTTSAERTKLHRDRKRLGLRPVQVLVSEREIDFLLARDYELTRTDDRSIGSAVSAFLSDSVLEGLTTPEGLITFDDHGRKRSLWRSDVASHSTVPRRLIFLRDRIVVSIDWCSLDQGPFRHDSCGLRGANWGFDRYTIVF
jgi:hypothetical protein